MGEFKSRAVLEKVLRKTHFDKFGMEVHAAPEGSAADSKSEVMFIPSAPRTYAKVDTTTTPPTMVRMCQKALLPW